MKSLSARTVVCALAALTTTAPALAQSAPGGAGSQQRARETTIYSCRDGNGRTITSDQPIPECLNREQRVLNRDGSLRRVIEAPLTPEQRAAREAQQRRETEEIQARELARQHDRVLLSSYSSVESLELARKRALAESESMLEVSQTRLVALEKERLALQGEFDFYKKTQPPAALQAKIDENARARAFEMALMQRRNEEIARINARFDADRARFIQLGGEPTTRR
ncbi:DUF4124 domain-containing protein [Derxia gummosa]|uniref:DUF4124 domain-containing protein n=1 Tax=Derxia gummosa DSM 723 TaxID=1121388 RepID=A0A8B6X8X1_9BURK|nr:DUF4124 domain-containing protein [Derxia gummosa]